MGQFIWLFACILSAVAMENQTDFGDYPHKKRCAGQNDGCCTKNTPCLLGEGDCDNDNECASGLVCGHDNCPWGDHDDCCKKPRCFGQDAGCCTKDTPCLLGQGDCDKDDECASGLVCGHDNCPWGDKDDCCRKRRCVGQDAGCCTKDTPCRTGEGDCDNDDQCGAGLVCGNNNCPWGDKDDCCVPSS